MKNDPLCIKEDVCDMATCDGGLHCSHAVLRSAVINWSCNEALKIEALKVVAILNNYLMENTSGTSTTFLEFWSNGDDCMIYFLGERIWASFDDNRNFIEQINDWEPLEPFIKKLCNDKINELKNQLFPL
jgi:hypothetical protein